MSAKNQKTFFFNINKYPSIILPFKIVYKYKTNIYGEIFEGYLNCKDSIVFDIYTNNFKIKESLLIDLRTNYLTKVDYHKIIPTIDKIPNKKYYYQMFRYGFVRNNNDTIKGLVLKITYQKGIEEINVLYRNKSELPGNSLEFKHEQF